MAATTKADVVAKLEALGDRLAGMLGKPGTTPEKKSSGGGGKSVPGNYRAPEDDPYARKGQILYKDDGKYNLNEKSTAETLRLSRLADRLNNKLYYTPTITTAHEGRAFSGGTVAQYPKIETEEMREMANLRSLEDDVRRKQAGVQNDWEKESLRRRQKDWDTWLERLQLPMQQYSLTRAVWDENTMAGAMLAQFFNATAPSKMQALTDALMEGPYQNLLKAAKEGRGVEGIIDEIGGIVRAVTGGITGATS